jgi:cytochrome b561
MSSTPADYGAAAKLLHWLIAAFVIALIGLGHVMDTGDLMLRFQLYQLHKSMGITVLLLMALRIALRIFVKPPDLPPHIQGVERHGARISHLGFYALLLLLPLSGWAMVSAATVPFNIPTLLYGQIPWPHIPAIEELSPERKKAVEPVFENVHAALGWVLLALLIVHVAAALRHAFILKDGIMSRMLPRFLKTSRNLVLFAALAAMAVAAGPRAEAQEWAINKEQSRITFEADAGGQKVVGEFKQFEAEIRFDPDHLDIAEISAAVDLNTVETGQPDVDKALLGKDWFDVQTYPTAGFRMTSIAPGETPGSYKLEANLSLKGKTRAVSLPFTLAVDQGDAKVKGEMTLDRGDFGIGPDGPVAGLVIGNTVRLTLDLIATRLDN